MHPHFSMTAFKHFKTKIRSRPGGRVQDGFVSRRPRWPRPCLDFQELAEDFEEVPCWVVCCHLVRGRYPLASLPRRQNPNPRGLGRRGLFSPLRSEQQIKPFRPTQVGPFEVSFYNMRIYKCTDSDWHWKFWEIINTYVIKKVLLS